MSMRSPFVRLTALVVGIVAVMSCDGGSVNPRFGNGIAGGSSGTAPISPTNPNAPDTSRPFVRIDTPAVVGQLVNVGDSILTVTRIIDDRQLQSLVVTGYKFTGSATWNLIYSGDGGFTEVDYSTPATVYEEYVYLEIRRSDNSGSTWTDKLMVILRTRAPSMPIACSA